MNKKGISPLIAAVLLIAFTMAVASLFAQWAPSLFKTTQGDIDETAADIQSCAAYNIEVSNANGSEATIQQVDGPEGLGNITVTWFYDGDTAKQSYANLTSATGIDSASIDESNLDSGATWIRTEAQSQECQTVISQQDNPDYVNGGSS
jgi:flagellin-like protein